ncbi:ABC transporter permease [Klenkia sp. PcliD-1-E]|uniref:ABC transporter permease n=1 Tax=Klenkia sp. PcliD-1-E TaxID=2954492 RepID=UPI002097E957|nr:hypothetical protein [Klenkia sp. PcliD-1-E]MCO7221383.1 hypothetical protein [Klenkia sp. PcliD-1-E]
MSALVGVAPLARVTLRQDARSIAPWIVGTTALSASSILAYDLLFDDPQERAGLAATLGSNPALGLVFGPARDLLTADGFNAWRAGALGGFLAALMAVTTVVRNSRADEDSGQAELLASGVVGRAARLQTALGLAWLASLVLGVVSWAVTVAVGGGVVDTAVQAATYTGAGLVFAGVAAVAAQLGADARSATSLAVGTLAVAFLARGFVDASGTATWLTWVTPLGWLQETRPAAGNRWWPLLPALALALALAVLAFVLQSRRDFGQGVVAARPGPARAGAVASVWGLALRLHRAQLVVWLGGLAALGAVFGAVVSSVAGDGADSPFSALLPGGGSSVVAAFVLTFLSLLGIVAAVPGVQIAQRVHAEETDHRVEPLLAGALRRSRFFASHAVPALAAPAVAVLLAGATMGAVVSSAGTGLGAGDVLAQAAATVPAVWAVVALALAVVGARPAVRLAGWLGVVASFALTLFGPTFRLPGWALGISPFHHVPDVTAASPGWTGLVVVGAAAAALTVVAFVGFGRRDVG